MKEIQWIVYSTKILYMKENAGERLNTVFVKIEVFHYTKDEIVKIKNVNT